MNDSKLSELEKFDRTNYADEIDVIYALVKFAALSKTQRQDISKHGARLVKEIRNQNSPALMEVFLAEYGLSTDEGIALMCLAEALLRVPDAETIDALIEDKIAPSDWANHLGKSTSRLVNASTWALMLTGKVLQEQPLSPVGHLRAAIKRVGEPIIRSAVNQAMKEMGRQFVLGESIQAALKRANILEQKGYTYSYDMLGEAALTNKDAEQYYLAYSQAISTIATACKSSNIHTNPGISVKLSALFPRYEIAQRDQVINILVPRLTSLTVLAKSAGIGLNIDAEESDRLTLSLEIIERVLSESALKGWDGFGVVVQAYGKRADKVIDWLYQLVSTLDRRITVRLVKGAYWDSEIKQAQIKGLDSFPVFTSKAATDVSYIANAKRLLGMADRIYPQFATHNAHTAAAILNMATDKSCFEFQRLHGMGEQLHELIKDQEQVKCRIYAPVGAHQDLLAYLVRRLLENGANSSFVNQIVDDEVPPEIVASDPFEQLASSTTSRIHRGSDLFEPERKNSRGWDITNLFTLNQINQDRQQFRHSQWHSSPLIAKYQQFEGEKLQVFNPALPTDLLGTTQHTTQSEVENAIDMASIWNVDHKQRSLILNKVADLYEQHHGELFALLAREAGKTLMDAVAEIREAVDFLRYYAANVSNETPVGVFACISPWNFPFAIFTGQISAALSAGNAVLAKPAEQTPMIAWKAVKLMHKAGVPAEVIQLLPGDASIGALLTQNPKVSGVVFTGSTITAKRIRRSMAQHLKAGAPFIAETGGINAMIVDSTALPEQAVTAIIESAFQSAGQRCSALRCLYIQEDVSENFVRMLFGAMDELQLGDPWLLNTDSGPVIDQPAFDVIQQHVEKASHEGRLLKTFEKPEHGTFFPPTVIKVNSIKDIEVEIFGPVLHVATFKANELNSIIDDINMTGYGLTFGLQTRIDDRVQTVCEQIKAGNVYINRNQIGAIVGSQPFGGQGLSGTGPKAGGPHYLSRFYQHLAPSQVQEPLQLSVIDDNELQGRVTNLTINDGLNSINLPGPTGESNLLSSYPREPILCLGPTEIIAKEQANSVRALGGIAIECGDRIPHDLTHSMKSFSAAIWWGDDNKAKHIDDALAQYEGPIKLLITGMPDSGHVLFEQHVCVDTTASGGNTELLATSPKQHDSFYQEEA